MQFSDGLSECTVQLTGTVETGERLFLPYAQDTDQLWHNGRLLDVTGYLLKYPFAASFLPRIYSLQALQGEVRPALVLKTQSYFSTSPATFPKAKVVPPTFSLRKAYLPLFLRTMGFALLLSLSTFLVFCIRRKTIDGWTYPIDELRWFFGALAGFLLLRSPYSNVMVPSVWSASFHSAATEICLAVTLWGLSSLLLEVRFNDRSCVERGLYHRPGAFYRRFSTLALLISLGVIASDAPPSSYPFTIIAFTLPLLFTLHASARALEWKRVLKRSGASPLAFHFSLMALAAALALHSLWWAFGFNANIVPNVALAVLGLGAWRMHRYFKAHRRAKLLAKECRAELLKFARGHERLHALSDFVEDEWAAARVSVISVESDSGLVLASAGPDAIPDVQHSRARKLGPFLRRVCKEGHILYAPVAEELGQDLRSQGLKHSSLAIPLHQQDRVRAVVCMMADEGERIPAIDATMLELLVSDLSLEILSAVAQHVAEKKCEHLLVIAREADGLAVEHLDDWGHLQYSDKEESRILLGAKLEAIAAVPASLVLRKAQTEFNRELRTVWHSLALAFEFVPREIKEDFWVLSPKEFRQPFLRALGAERVSILLAAALDRHARILAARENYLLLAQPAPKISLGETKLRLVSYGAHENGGYEIDSQDFEILRRLRDRSNGAGPAFCGVLLPDCAAFKARLLPMGRDETREYFSILSVFADRKEIRKLETKALENAKESLRKAA